MARIALEQGDAAGARDHLRAATALGERLANDASRQPGTIELLADLRRQMAEIEWRSGDAESAEAFLRLAIDGRTRLVEADPKNVMWQRDLEKDLTKLHSP